MLCKGLGKYLILLVSALAALTLQPAGAVPVSLSTNLVFDGSNSNDEVSAQRLGFDTSGDYITFQVNPLGPFGAGPGIVYHRRLDGAGGAIDAPRIIGQNLNNEVDPDGSGNLIVYTSDDDFDGVGDAIRIYDVSLGLDFLVADSAQPISDARISGDTIVWRQGDVVLSQKVSLLGTGDPPVVYRGPLPAASDPEVGSRYIVWSEQISGLFDKEVRAHEIGGSAFFVTPDDVSDGFDEILPTTSGEMIAFGLVDTSTGLSDIVLRDLLADTTASFSLGLEELSSLSLGEDFLAFNALDGAGVMQAYILGLVDGGLLQLTSGSEGSSSVDVFGDLVAYTSGERLFVANLADEVSVVPLPPAMLLFGAGIACLAGFARRCSKKAVNL